MEILKLGRVTTNELASWFKISKKTLSSKKQQYLEKLKYFCNFEPVYNGVNIKEIYIDTYVKNLKGDEKIYLEQVKATESHITSLSGMAAALKEKDEFKNYSVETLRGRMRRAGAIAFGTTKDEESQGLYGTRQYVWAIKLYDRPNHYRNFTIEENKIFDEIISNFYTTQPERIKKAVLLEQTYKEDQTMTKEEYFKQKELLNLNMFFDVICEFKKATGYQVVKATAHEIDLEYIGKAF